MSPGDYFMDHPTILSAIPSILLQFHGKCCMVNISQGMCTLRVTCLLFRACLNPTDSVLSLSGIRVTIFSSSQGIICSCRKINKNFYTKFTSKNTGKFPEIPQTFLSTREGQKPRKEWHKCKSLSKWWQNPCP